MSEEGMPAGGCRKHHSPRGFYQTSSGKRRRYLCRSCGKTFCANTSTPYYRLQHRRATFDEVAALSVEGLNKSAIARVKQIAWNTVARWLENAACSCRRCNDRRIATPAVAELQADEIRTIVGCKEQPIWIFTTIDVWSRLWPATVVGRRSYRNTLALFQRRQPNESCTCPSGRHRWLPVLQESCPSRLWASLSLWSGDQDAYERSHCQGRAKSRDRRRVAIRRDATPLRGLQETQHFFRRAAASQDPTGLGLSISADDLPRALEGAPGRSPGIASLPLQLREASQGAEIRWRDEDTSDASWADHATVDVK